VIFSRKPAALPRATLSRAALLLVVARVLPMMVSGQASAPHGPSTQGFAPRTRTHNTQTAQTNHTHTHSLSLSPPLSLTHTHTRSHSHTHTYVHHHPHRTVTHAHTIVAAAVLVTHRTSCMHLSRPLSSICKPVGSFAGQRIILDALAGAVDVRTRGKVVGACYCLRRARSHRAYQAQGALLARIFDLVVTYAGVHPALDGGGYDVDCCES